MAGPTPGSFPNDGDPSAAGPSTPKPLTPMRTNPTGTPFPFQNTLAPDAFRSSPLKRVSTHQQPTVGSEHSYDPTSDLGRLEDEMEPTSPAEPEIRPTRHESRMATLENDPILPADYPYRLSYRERTDYFAHNVYSQERRIQKTENKIDKLSDYMSQAMEMLKLINASVQKP